MTKISVVMPVYNTKEVYLREAIESILNQSFGDFEFIIIDDGSDNNAANVIKSYDDKRIRYIYQTNQGIVAALNNGFSISNGKYIARMDSDDIAFPNRLKEQYEYMEKHKNVGLCGTQIEEFNDKGEIVEFFNTFKKNPNIRDILFQPIVCHPTAMFRKSVLKKFNIKYSKNYLHAEDQDMWHQIIKHSKIVVLPEKLLHYRRHDASISNVNAEIGIKNYDKVKIEILTKLHPNIKVDETNLNELINLEYQKINNKNSILKEIFSVTNIKRHNYIGKQVKILGIKLKFKNKYKTLQKKFDMRLNDLETKLNNNKNEFENKLATYSKIIREIIYSKNNTSTDTDYQNNISNNNDSRIREELTSLGKFYFLPNRGNLGDVVIAAAEYQYFDSLNLEYEVFQQAPDEEFNLVYGGGGQWVQYYDCSDIIDIFRNPKIKKIVILPSSINQCSNLVEFMDERFTVFCREEQSYNYCISKNSRAKFIQADDMAFGFNINNICKYNKLFEINNNDFIKIYTDLYENYKVVHNQIDKIKELTAIENDKRIGYFLRKDIESNNNWENCSFKHNLDISNLMGTYGLDKNFCYILSKLFLSIIDTVDIVVTDRLHVGICGHLLGKQVILIDNSYGKVSGVYNYTMKKFDNVHYTTADNLKNTVESIAQNSQVSPKHNIKIISDIISFYNEYCSDKNYDLIEKIMWTWRDL